MARENAPRVVIAASLAVIFAALALFSLVRVRHDVGGNERSEPALIEMTTRGGLEYDADGLLVETRPALPPAEDAADAETAVALPVPPPAPPPAEPAPCPT